LGFPVFLIYLFVWNFAMSLLTWIFCFGADTVAAEQSGKLKKLLKASSASKEQSVESEL
jgi:hypothetical protein